MRYILEWNQGSFPSDDWSKITNHEQYLNGSVFEKCFIGYFNSKPVFSYVAI